MEKIGLKYGLFTAFGLIGYFLLMKLFGLELVIGLRFFNGLIMAVGVTMAIRARKKSLKGNIGYFQGLGTGILTAVLATVVFAVFMVVYIKVFDNALLKVLAGDQFFGDRVAITPGVVIFMVLVLEGIISGFMVSFIAMQWFKRPDHKVPGSP
jgi:ABC-type Co2+ transport system permease subunit